MRILRYILATLAVLATFTACREEDELNKAKGRVVLGEIRIEAEEANTRAISIPTPQPEDLTIEIIDPDGYTIESGKIDHYANGIDLFVASYTLRAYYGNKQQMGNSPYFEGIAEFSISEGQTTQIGTVTAKLANAVIIPNIPTNIIDHFIGVPTFYVCKGEEKKEVTNGQALYVLPGEYTLSLEGTNKLGVAVNNTQKLNTEEGKVYNINGDLKLPTLELPDQTAGAWAKKLYITPVNATNPQGEKYTPKGVIYKILPENSSDWDNATSIQDNEGTGENVVFTGLTPGTTYLVKAEMASIASNIISVKTETELQIPNHNMEDWHYVRPEHASKYWEIYYACSENTEPVWNTLNELTTSEGGNQTNWFNRNGCRYSANSGTISTTDKAGGNYAALIRTVGWGKDNSAHATQDYAIATCSNVTSGELYLGTYNATTTSPDYGYNFDSRPIRLEFHYKYVPKNPDDYFITTITVKDKNKNIITEKVIEGTAQSTYNIMRIDLDYQNNYRTKAGNICISFKSTGNPRCLAANSSNLTGPPARNTSDGEYIGSQLYIDDIELIYE